MDTQNSFASQAPTNTPEPQAFNNYNQPKKKSTTPIIIMLVILVLVLGGVIAFLLLRNSNKDNTSTGKDSKESEVAETEITSETVKKDLFEKMKIVLLESWNNDFKYDDKTAVLSGYDFPFKLFKEGTNNDGTKFYSISLYFDNTHLTKFSESPKGRDYAKSIFAKENNPNFKYLFSSAEDFLNDEESVFVEGSTFDKKYKAVYGEDIKAHKTNEYCGGLFYDSEINVYYAFSGGRQCGGASPEIVNLYFDSYTQKGNEAYINIYGANAVNESESANKQCGVRSLEQTESFHNCDTDEAKILNSYFATSPSIINDSNKEKYSHYRFVFSGENSDYHFVKVEKVTKE